MNKRATALLSALLVLLPIAAGAAQPSTDRIIVKWRNPEAAMAPVSEARLQKVATRTNRLLQPGHAIGGALSVVQLSRTQQGAELDATLAALRADPDVELAVPDGRVKIQAVTPSDPLFSDVLAYQGVNYDRQWYLKSVQPAAIRADAAWEITRGGASAATSSVVVAVLDTGVRLGHPDLAGKLLQGFDFVSNTAIANDGNGWDNDPSDPGDFLTPDDLTRAPFKGGDCGDPSNSSWHGTRVSGLIAADTDNGIGMAGTGFHIRILPVRVLGKCGGYDSDVIAGMYWAAGLAPPPPYIPAGQTIPPVNPTPAQVLNMSLGGADPCTTQNAAVYRAAVNDIVAHGVVIVASAGNDGKAVGTPGSCVGVLGVAGVRHAGTKVGYSNLGPEVGIAAPAGNCVFVANQGDPCVYALNSTSNSGTQTPDMDVYTSPTVQPSYGTSFSTPLVAGTAGLMKAVNPTLTPAKLIERIKTTARPFPATSDTQPQPPACVLPSVNALQAAECICNTQVCGAGMLDAEAAVRAAQRPVAVAQVTGTVVAGRSATLDGSKSAAAAGRSITSYQWSVVAAPGSTPPTIQSANEAIASVTAPGSGTLLLRLTLTDNFGATDTAEVSITGSGDTSTTSPPPTSGGGGGRLDLLLLALMLALWLRRLHHPHRRAAH